MKDDTDFKGTKKLCWLDAKSPLVFLIYYIDISEFS